MNRLTIFIVRVILGGVFAVVICRLFRPSAGPGLIVGLGVCLVGAAYGLEYVKGRKSDTQGTQKP